MDTDVTLIGIKLESISFLAIDGAELISSGIDIVAANGFAEVTILRREMIVLS